jgi:predicted lactoylglutathione lyase
MRPTATPARLALGGSGGGRVTPEDVVDDGSSYSLYVADPDGNAVEITTYDQRAIERALKC